MNYMIDLYDNIEKLRQGVGKYTFQTSQAKRKTKTRQIKILNALEGDRNEIPKVVQKVDAIHLKIQEIGNNVKPFNRVDALHKDRRKNQKIMQADAKPTVTAGVVYFST